MATNDFLPFANDASANVDSQANYLAAQTGGGYSQLGFSAGLAASNKANKAIRQSSVVSTALTNLIVSQLAQSVADSGGAASVTALSAQILALMQAASQSAAPPLKPQGRLTLTTNTPILAAGVAGATVCYYTAYEGNQIPVWTGTQFLNLTFAADLVLTLTAAAAANAIVDVFAINQAGLPVLGFGPVWANSTAGAGARGTGAGTTELVRKNGLWTNANIITLLNGASTYSAIPANQATYLGSLYADSAAGQVSCLLAFGQSRKWGVWNAYNRRPIVMQAGDATASWIYGTTTWRASNGSAANAITAFTGLPEEFVPVDFSQFLSVSASGITIGQNGIGINSTTILTGKSGAVEMQLAGANTGGDAKAIAIVPPALGLTQITCLEYASANATYSGASQMRLSASYNG